MNRYLEKLKNKLKFKKLERDQPIAAWLFILLLNIVGFAGYFYLKLNKLGISN